MSRWFTPVIGSLGLLFLSIGLWEYLVAGAYKLILAGTVTLALLATAQSQRRSFKSRSAREQE